MQSGRRRICNVRKATGTGTIARVPGPSGVVEDPRTRLETCYARTGDLGDTCRPTGQQVGGRKLRPHGPRVRPRGVGQRNSTYEAFEQRPAPVHGECGGKAADQGEHSSIWYVPDTERVCAWFHGWGSVRTSCTLGRYSSAIRAACANRALVRIRRNGGENVFSTIGGL